MRLVRAVKSRLTRFARAFNTLLVDTWFFEIISIFFSIAALAATVGLLISFQKKPVLQWRWHLLTLNTAVSILMTVSKTLLLFVISSCIGQWKYITFAKMQRNLIEFDILDSASRGPQGSLYLLWYSRLGFRSLAALGAALTVLSLGLDPFAQQILGFGTLQLQSDASIAQALRYSRASTVNTSGYGDVGHGFVSPSTIYNIDFSMQSAIFSGLSDNLETINQRISVSCPSGDCRWKPYQSLAVCSLCTNVTNLLQKTVKKQDPSVPPSLPQVDDFETNSQAVLHDQNETAIYALPNGLHLDNDQGTDLNISIVAQGTSNASTTVTFKGSKTLLWAMAMIQRLETTGPLIPLATECGLYFCLKNFSSQVTNGSISETSTVVNATMSTKVVGDYPSNPESAAPYEDIALNGNFSIFESSINAIMEGMKGVFVVSGLNISNTGASSFALIDQSGALTQYGPNSMQPIFQSREDPGELFDKLAVSMTNNFRSNDDHSTRFSGTSGTTVYTIRWPWISLSLIITLLTCVFLLHTMLLTRIRDVPLWKSSSLPMLKCGTEVVTLFAPEDRVGRMEDIAEKEHMTLFNPSPVPPIVSARVSLSADADEVELSSIHGTSNCASSNHEDTNQADSNHSEADDVGQDHEGAEQVENIDTHMSLNANIDGMS